MGPRPPLVRGPAFLPPAPLRSLHAGTPPSIFEGGDFFLSSSHSPLSLSGVGSRIEKRGKRDFLRRSELTESEDTDADGLRLVFRRSSLAVIDDYEPTRQLEELRVRLRKNDVGGSEGLRADAWVGASGDQIDA